MTAGGYDLQGPGEAYRNAHGGGPISAAGRNMRAEEDAQRYAQVHSALVDARTQLEREYSSASFTEVKDSGERRTFETGSVRDVRTGKGRFDLLPPYAVKRIAQHFENGAVKYGDRNWEKGQDLSSTLDSALRHIFAFLGGDRSEDHLSAGAWNLMATIETEQRIREGRLPASLNNLPPVQQGIGMDVPRA